MIGYVTLGTRDLARAKRFYDALLGELDANRTMETERFAMWSTGSIGLGVALPFDGKPATVGNGVMIALSVKDKAKVDMLHKKAIELGGSDEGAPGPRGQGFYAAYFRDLDGNKLNCFCAG